MQIQGATNLNIVRELKKKAAENAENPDQLKQFLAGKLSSAVNKNSIVKAVIEENLGQSIDVST